MVPVIKGHRTQPPDVVLIIEETQNPMKPHARAAFEEALRNLALLNSQALAHRAELAASLARSYPYYQQPLLKIEQSRAQLQVIAGLSFTSAAAVGIKS